MCRVHKFIHFSCTDVKDLISILADSQGECSMISSYKMDTSDSVCPPRVRAMLASRACRSSVMIGDPLGRNEMYKVLPHVYIHIVVFHWLTSYKRQMKMKLSNRGKPPTTTISLPLSQTHTWPIHFDFDYG